MVPKPYEIRRMGRARRAKLTVKLVLQHLAVNDRDAAKLRAEFPDGGPKAVSRWPDEPGYRAHHVADIVLATFELVALVQSWIDNRAHLLLYDLGLVESQLRWLLTKLQERGGEPLLQPLDPLVQFLWEFVSQHRAKLQPDETGTPAVVAGPVERGAA